MNPLRRPASLVAERAVRYLRSRGKPASSLEVAREVLATTGRDEATALTVLEAAFDGDSRLVYEGGAWRLGPSAMKPAAGADEAVPEERDRVYLLQEGARPAPGRPYELRTVAAVRVRGETVVAACGGEPVPGYEGESLRQELLNILDGAVAVVHDAPGALAALERWLEEPLDPPLSLRQLARQRLGLPANHDLEALAEKLDLEWRSGEELLDQAEAMDACLEALKEPTETILDLQAALTGSLPPIPWSRYDFDRSFLRQIPRVAGTYRFFDAEGKLLYVGKSKNLHKRIGSYFRQGTGRSSRVQALVDALHHIEYEPLQSDLEAVLQEAAEIRRKHPERNVLRRVHPRPGSRGRLDSIIILEPAASPLVLRAFLIRNGSLLAKVGIGPRGGGLARIERVLEDHFFSVPMGPTPTGGPDLDVELVGRWLAANRDRVVAFDPTHLRGASDVTDRLRYFLGGGAMFDPDGSPVLVR